MGERLVRQGAWWTTEHREARWFRVLSATADWSKVRVQVALTPDAAEVSDFDVTIRPAGYILPQQKHLDLGAEAIRVISTAVRAAQRAEAGA